METARELSHNQHGADGDPTRLQGHSSTTTMTPVKQATLLNYHLAIEDSVDLDKIWNQVQPLFSSQEQVEIKSQENGREGMKILLDILSQKNDEAFDQMVESLRTDYKWLAERIEQGVAAEESRLKKLGRGIKRKLALALLTARISERQKDGIIDRLTEVVESEVSQKCMRVSIPDHRMAAHVDTLTKRVQFILHEEVHPVLYSKGAAPSEETDDPDDAIEMLRNRLHELKVLQDSYKALNVTGKTGGDTLPVLLRQKIDEVQVTMGILQQEKQAAERETLRLNREKDDLARSLSRLEQRNRQLELDNHSLEAENKQMEDSLRRLHASKWETEKDREKAEGEKEKLKSQLQTQQDRISELVVWNKNLDIQNTKLTRDIQKFTAANVKLRKESRSGSGKLVVKLKSEHKKLTEERQRLKKEVQKLDEEKRKLTIRLQKLAAENQHLREQKKKLTSEKKKVQAESKELKKEAKRLALGKQSSLPPIAERMDRGRAAVKDGARSRAGKDSRSVSPQHQPTAGHETSHSTSRGAGPSNLSQRGGKKKSESPWNKYKNEDSKRQGAGDNGNDASAGDDEDDEAVTKQPSYMVSTASSRKKDYVNGSFREESPRRSAAHN